MTPAGRAVELLIAEAWEAQIQSRYQRMSAAAGRAVEAAEQLDEPGLLVRALVVEAVALRALGEDATALARYTRVLALAEDPATRDRLDQPGAARAMARSYMDWVECAQFVPRIPARQLFEVLDAAEAWLAATGHHGWRAGVLLQRASVHRELREWDAAIAVGEEALAAYDPDAPGYTVGSHRSLLGDILHDAGRSRDAEPHYQAILDDPASSPHDRYLAFHGLAWCALDRADSDPGEARQHALAAVKVAGPLGYTALSRALGAVAAAHRAAGDLDAAWDAATRYLDAAGRVGDHMRLFYATRAAVDIAIDRKDLDSARRLLADLDAHADALDAGSATTPRAADAAHRRWRLMQLSGEAS